MMNRQIIISNQNWNMISQSLYKTRKLESALFAFYKESTTSNSHKILITDILLPTNDDYHVRNSSHVAFKPEFTHKALRYCINNNCHLLDIHTHPWSKNVSFSSIDDNEAMHTKIPYLKKYLHDVKISFIVLGESETIAQARMWDKTTNMIESIYKIVIF